MIIPLWLNVVLLMNAVSTMVCGFQMQSNVAMESVFNQILFSYVTYRGVMTYVWGMNAGLVNVKKTRKLAQKGFGSSLSQMMMAALQHSVHQVRRLACRIGSTAVMEEHSHKTQTQQLATCHSREGGSANWICNLLKITASINFDL